MNESNPKPPAIQISYVLFFVVLILFLYFVYVFDRSKGTLSLAPIAALFACAFGWQICTAYSNRKSFLSWLLVGIYGIAAIAFTLSAAHE